MAYLSALSQWVQIIIALYTFNITFNLTDTKFSLRFRRYVDFKKERAKLAPALNNFSDLLLSILAQ